MPLPMRRFVLAGGLLGLAGAAFAAAWTPARGDAAHGARQARDEACRYPRVAELLPDVCRFVVR